MIFTVLPPVIQGLGTSGGFDFRLQDRGGVGPTQLQQWAPHLDELANAGVLFAGHYCQAVPCGPSRASLHTGLYMMNHRSVINGTPLDRRHANWALRLRAAGYDPVLFGYTDTSADPREYPADAPELRTYEGLLPGLRPEVLLNESDVSVWAD